MNSFGWDTASVRCYNGQGIKPNIIYPRLIKEVRVEIGELSVDIFTTLLSSK